MKMVILSVAEGGDKVMACVVDDFTGRDISSSRTM